MNLGAWIFLVIITLIFVAAIAYGNYYTWYARKNPEYFRLSLMEKDILRLQKRARKRTFFDSSVIKIMKPIIIFSVLSCVIFAFLGKNSDINAQVFILSEVSFISFFLLLHFFISLLIHKKSFDSARINNLLNSFYETRFYVEKYQ